MASRKLVRDVFLSRQSLCRNFVTPQQISGMRSRRMVLSEGYVRQFSVFNEFSKKIKGEASNNPEFQKTVKELKEKTEGVKEDLKVRTKQTTEQLYKRVDGVWTEAEAAAKKVSANVKEKISAAKEDVKETFQFGKQSSSESSNASGKSSTDGKDTSGSAPGEDKHQKSTSSESAENLFGNFRSGVSSASSKVSMAMQKMKEAKVIDFAKKGYDIVKEELTSTPSRRHHLHPQAPSSTTVERSTRTDVVVVPTKQSPWRKKWETLKEKMRQHPTFKRISEPVVTKSQEIVEDAREIWETSDNPVVHKIQDINESVFGETATAISFKEIRRHDPSFSLPEFVAQVQEITRPVVEAYMKGNTEILTKYCCPEVIERCKAEHRAWESQGVFFDNKLLHISDLEVMETKLLGESPIIVLRFQTQQIHCVRDRHGAITEGGKDTIHTVVYAWAMQQVDPEELGEGAMYPIWRLREVQQMGWQALI